jgi:hypothetical protein
MPTWPLVGLRVAGWTAGRLILPRGLVVAGARGPRRGGFRSIGSPGGAFSFLSPFSLGSAFSMGSVASFASILSIGSSGSILSIGSAGSILSIGSAGSVLCIGSTGGLLRIGGPRPAGSGDAEEQTADLLPDADPLPQLGEPEEDRPDLAGGGRLADGARPGGQSPDGAGGRPLGE